MADKKKQSRSTKEAEAEATVKVVAEGRKVEELPSGLTVVKNQEEEYDLDGPYL